MRRRAVSNASPLIFLAKIDLLDMLKHIYGEILITRIVKHECVEKGKRKGFEDAVLIEKLIQEGFINVIPLDKESIKAAKRLARDAKIHIGEATTILFAKNNNISEIIIDDKKARTVAKIYGLKPRGTTSLILELAYRQIISKEKTKKLIDNLIDKGFWISIEIYKKIITAINNIKQ